MKKLRCAIYTRKSSEEGLEQNFNSLDAQREACGAYILSQAGEGWTAIKQTYEDGGFSGGNIERPGLQALLTEIKAGRIDVVVVYKVDRLTRSLADFAKIVEILDKSGASFVSVTQAFNTTTSMGRLTLNVLLSFAQFEREVTSERIRDKFAASKAKGMWMGGNLPLGYDVRERQLAVNDAEAEIVRFIFERYLKCANVRDVLDDLQRRGFKSKSWTSRTGNRRGGKPFSRGAIYYLLRSRLYLGEIYFRGVSYPGQHHAIIEQSLFDAVQSKLNDNQSRAGADNRRGASHALLGLLFDDRGNAMTGTHANKKGRRYLYYVSTATNIGNHDRAGSLPRVSAPLIENAARTIVEPLLKHDWLPDQDLMQRAVSALARVTLSNESITLQLKRDALDPRLIQSIGAESDDEHVTISHGLKLSRRATAQIINVDGQNVNTAKRIDRALVRSVVLARKWAQMLESGAIRSVEQLAKSECLCVRNTTRILPLAYLAPDLVEMILAGDQPASLTVSKLTEADLPLAWAVQRALFAQYD